MSLRSPLGRVTGLGSAKDGTAHWWAQRVTAVALAPLTLWFVISLLSLPALDYDTVYAWASVPLSGFLSFLLVVVCAYHGYLGAVVIIEDYVTSKANKVISLVLMRFVFVVFGGACAFAILRIALGNSHL